jgi:lipoate-protein ligase A
MRKKKWRLIIDPPAAAYWNMAVDETIFEGGEEGKFPSTLRFYQWQPAALSLGRYQPVGEIDLSACQQLGIDWVRRVTGGGCVLHSAEITYSLFTTEGQFTSLSVLDFYQWVNRVLVDAFQSLGLEVYLKTEKESVSSSFCFLFSSQYDILAGGKKLVGSAQKRSRGKLLQHGSILLKVDERIKKIVKNSSSYSPKKTMVGIFDLLGKELSPGEIETLIAAKFEENWGIKFFQENLSWAEEKQAQILEREKYRNPQWNFQKTK